MTVTVGVMFICSNIGAKSFGDGSQDIYKDTESNLGPVAGFWGWNYPEISFFNLYVTNLLSLTILSWDSRFSVQSHGLKTYKSHDKYWRKLKG